jgi:hypothetical protein
MKRAETLTNIGTINKTEQVQQRNGWHDIQVDFHAKSGFGLGIKLNQGLSILVSGDLTSFRLCYFIGFDFAFEVVGRHGGGFVQRSLALGIAGTRGAGYKLRVKESRAKDEWGL